jgi:hypothetical protein
MAEKYVIVRREPTAEMARHGAADCSLVTHRGAKAVYAAMISASPSPVSTQEIVEALTTVDDDIRHHLRSDEVAPALIRPHAIKAVRSLLSRLKDMNDA